jgi:hypothetical protein
MKCPVKAPTATAARLRKHVLETVAARLPKTHGSKRLVFGIDAYQKAHAAHAIGAAYDRPPDHRRRRPNGERVDHLQHAFHELSDRRIARVTIPGRRPPARWEHLCVRVI